MHVKDRYPLPLETPAGRHSMESLAERLTRFDALCAQHGISTKNTRIDRYRRYFKVAPSGWDLDQGIFIDPPDNPIQHGLDRLLYVLREVHELAWIGEGLRDAETIGLAEKLRTIVRGADFAALDRNTESRNTQFELRIASYLARAGYRLDFSSLTDIVATRKRTTYFVECKRVASPGQLKRRIKEAVDQISLRMPKNGLFHGRHGIVAIDVTKVAFSQNGLTIGMTPDHSRDIIRDKLAEIEGDLGADFLPPRPRIVGLWLQIHIPALSLRPPMPTTRFSNLFLTAYGPDLRSIFACAKFYRDTVLAPKSDPGDEPPAKLELRRRLTFPAGTEMSFDETLLGELVATGELPVHPNDHEVFAIRPPGGGEFEPYSYFELNLAWINLSPEEKRQYASSMDEARKLMIGPLVAQRHRYNDGPSWLDGEPPADTPPSEREPRST